MTDAARALAASIVRVLTISWLLQLSVNVFQIKYYISLKLEFIMISISLAINNGNKSCFGCCKRYFRYRINQTILQNCRTALRYRRFQYASPILGIELSVVANYQ